MYQMFPPENTEKSDDHGSDVQDIKTKSELTREQKLFYKKKFWEALAQHFWGPNMRVFYGLDGNTNYEIQGNTLTMTHSTDSMTGYNDKKVTIAPLYFSQTYDLSLEEKPAASEERSSMEMN